MAETVKSSLGLKQPIQAIKFTVNSNQGYVDCPYYYQLDRLLTKKDIILKPKEKKFSRGYEPIIIEPNSPQERYGMWFAGLIEAGGTVDLKIGTKQNNEIYLIPRIRMQDDDPGRLAILFESVKRAYRFRKINHWTLDKDSVEISGMYAMDFAVAARPFAPSRDFVLQCFLEWATGYLQTDILLAEKYQKHPNPSRLAIPTEQYLEKLKNPYFLAGVFDSRGIYSNTPRADNLGKSRRMLRLRTKNKNLLEALCIHTGVQISKPTQTGSREFRVSGTKCEEILSPIEKHLRILNPTSI